MRDWMNDENNIYIGRKNVVFVENIETRKKQRFPQNDSLWANPLKKKEQESNL